MTRRLTAALVATISLAALPEVAAADPWKVKQKTKSATVAGGQTETVTVRCSRGYAALSGAFTTLSSGVTTLRSVPSGKRSWIFAAGNGLQSEGSFSVAVNCAYLRPPSGFTSRFGVSTRKKEVELQGQEVESLTIK